MNCLARSFIIFYLFAPISLTGQSSFHFEHLGLEEGLSQSRVMSIVQDTIGFLWFATQDGLNRYDGRRFHVFRHSAKDTATLPANYIGSLLVSKKGTLWVGTYTRGLCRFDPVSELFVRWYCPEHKDRYLNELVIRSLCEDTSGHIWMGTSAGVVILDPVTMAVRHFRHDPKNDGSISSDGIRSITRDSLGRMWCATRNGVSRFDPASGQFIHYTHRPNDERSIANNTVWIVQADRQGTVWCGTADGLSRYNRTTDDFTTYRNTLTSPPSLTVNNSGYVYEDSHDRLWFGMNDGLHILNQKSGVIEEVSQNPLVPGSLPSNAVGTIFEDRSGVMWFGFGTYGIAKFDPEKLNFGSVYSIPFDPTSLPKRSVRHLFEDSKGTLWVATDGGGISYRLMGERIFRHLPIDSAAKRGIPVPFVNSIVEWRGEMWFGTRNNGIVRYNPATKKFRTISAVPHDTTKLASDVIVDLLVDRRGSLWITSGRIAGLHRLDSPDGPFHRFMPDSANRYKLKTTSLSVIFEDRRGRLWFGSTTDGTYLFDQTTGRFHSFLFDPADETSISDNGIISIAEDIGGTMWFGTSGSGLNRYNEKEGTFTRFTTDQGLPNNYIYGILPDARGNLWMSTNSGIAKLNVKTLEVKTYDAENNLQSNEFNTNSLCAGRDGRMYFGGINGFNEFHPDSIRERNYRPRVVITSCIVNDTMTIPLAARPDGYGLTFPHNLNTIELETASLDFSIPRRIQYRYMLEGFEDQWVNSGNRRTVRYSNLPPGSYTFRMFATNSDGVWNERGTTLNVVIEPAFWKTWWFRALYIASFLGFILLMYMREIAQMRKEKLIRLEFSKKQIESLEAERKRLASELHDGLGQNLLVVNNELHMFLNDRKETQEELQRVAALVQESVESVREISSNLHPHHIERIGFCSAVQALTDNVSHSAKLNIICTCDTIDHRMPKEVEIHLYRIIQEGLSNIVRHAAARTVRIEVRTHPQSINIIIADDGCGFDPREFREDRPPQPSDEIMRGFGLASMSERARIIGGTLTIDSSASTGTTIHCSLPLSKG